MKVVTQVRELKKLKLENVVTAVGNFDGVHVGHKVIIDRVVSEAKKLEGTSVIITFKTHPVKIVEFFCEPHLITSTTHKLRLIAERQVDVCYLIDFDSAFAKVTAEKFIKDILHKSLHIKKIIAGFNFRFGKGQKGDNSLLVEYSQKLGFEVAVIDKIALGDRSLSSTAIRKAIKEADFNLIDEFLGRRYSLLGRVVRGASVGKEIGFPTANVNPFQEIVPSPGAYVVYVTVEDNQYKGVLNIGYAPYFVKRKKKNELKVEVYILDFAQDIYGKEIEVFFIQKIREEILFDKKVDLASQIRKDVQKAEGIFKQQKLLTQSFTK